MFHPHPPTPNLLTVAVPHWAWSCWRFHPVRTEISDYAYTVTKVFSLDITVIVVLEQNKKMKRILYTSGTEWTNSGWHHNCVWGVLQLLKDWERSCSCMLTIRRMTPQPHGRPAFILLLAFYMLWAAQLTFDTNTYKLILFHRLASNENCKC